MNKLENLELFLNKHGFRVIKYKPFSVVIDFIDFKEVHKMSENFFESRELAELEADPDKQNAMYKKSWNDLYESQKKFFPKLEVIADVISEFYTNRDTPYKNLIFLYPMGLTLISITVNEDVYEYFKKDNNFVLEIQKEFFDFDNFLKKYI